jgi:hypothetical protein
MKVGWVIMKMLQPQWKSLLLLKHSLEDHALFTNNLQAFEEQVSDRYWRRRIIALMVTDISMLICFGALFPPLAVIIALSILKDMMSIRLALGRYCEIMEAVQDESLKEQMVKVRESMDEEILKAGAGIWNGVWYGMVMSTWIWGFVLFDTMASVEGVEKGLCVLIGMVATPYICYCLFEAAAVFCNKGSDADATVTVNDNSSEVAKSIRSSLDSNATSWVEQQTLRPSQKELILANEKENVAVERHSAKSEVSRWSSFILRASSSLERPLLQSTDTNNPIVQSNIEMRISESQGTSKRN